jgi:hypothetical protein
VGDDQPPAVWVAEAVRRASRKDFARWEAMVHASGCCAQPVRLSGRVWAVDPTTGDTTLAYSTAGEADRVLLKACGTRRARRCPACASTYRADAKTLLRAGLAFPDPDGTDDGTDRSGDRPVVFVTLTAPSFGPVHRARNPPGACRTSPGRGACRHGVALACAEVHQPGDGRHGQAVCDACYDWAGAVVFNARAGELWRRTTIAVTRRLAGVAGVPVRRFKQSHRLEFAKVVEFQARGVVHVHALARLDRHDSDLGVDGDMLAEAFAAAAARTAAPNPLRPARPLRWGPQVDVEVIPARRRRAAAAYLAKYATKSVDDDGLLDRRLRSGDLEGLGLPGQLAHMAATAWDLGGQAGLAGLNLRAWAHSLGYRGHWLTKSRGWSTTFGELRAARQRWRLAQAGITPAEIANRWGEWDYHGVGHTNAGDAWLAASANAARRLNRRAAWEET